MRSSLVFIVLLLFPLAVFADTVFLKNGRSFSGQVKGQTRANIELLTANGVQVIRKSNIKSIKFGITNAEKARRNKRKAEMARRRKQLALAQQQKKQAQIAAEQKRLAELKKQAEKEDQNLKEREKKVLSVEEELARLNKREGDLRKELEKIRDRRRALGDDSVPLNSREIIWRIVNPGGGTPIVRWIPIGN